MASITERQGTILNVIVDGFIETGNPVASSVIASDFRLRVSPATVRNEMAGLEEDGYITRPHSSAGGVPADKGYRYFVEDIGPSHEPAARDLVAIRAALEQSRRDMEEWADSAASIVAALLRTLAFASPPRAESSRVKQLELVLLQDLTVMLVLILHETTVLKQLIALDAPTSQAELSRVRGRLRETVAGRSAAEILRNRGGHVPALPADRGGSNLETVVLDSTIGALQSRDRERSSDYNIEGLGRLLGNPELAHDDYGVALTDSLETGATLTELAESAPEDGSAAVFIGAENQRAEFRRCSVIVARYGVPNEASGVVGLIGPTRLAYRRAVPVVESAAALLSNLVTDAYFGHPYTPGPA